METEIRITHLEQVPEAINMLINQVAELKRLIADKAPQQTKTPQQTEDRILTRAQAKDVLNVSFATLKKWTAGGKVQAYRIGSQVRYYESDLKKALTAFAEG